MAGVLILCVNTLYRYFCFFKLFPIVGKAQPIGKGLKLNTFGGMEEVGTCMTHMTQMLVKG